MPVDTSASMNTKAYIAEQVKEIADVETVAEYLGLEMRRFGSKISILCPCHQDRHFKSCYLTNTGFRCYSCNARGDMIELVQHVLKVSFEEACRYILNIYGHELKEIAIQKPAKRTLKNEDLELIGLGLPQENKSLYKELAVFSSPDDVDLERGQRLTWMPGLFVAPGSDHNEEDLYVLQELVSSNPLRDLLNEDELTYNEMIFRKAKEASEKYQNMLDMVTNPTKYLFGDDIAAAYIAALSIEVAKVTGVQLWIDEMTRRIRRCDDIRIEFDTSRNQKEKSINQPKKRKSVFGKIKTGGAPI